MLQQGSAKCVSSHSYVKCVIVKVIFGTLKRHSSGQHVGEEQQSVLAHTAMCYYNPIFPLKYYCSGHITVTPLLERHQRHARAES